MGSWPLVRVRRWKVKFPTIQWRAVLLPASVAIGSILVLAWYNFVWIPAQQRYLNERNLRVLRTISAQIKAKVDPIIGKLYDRTGSGGEDNSEDYHEEL